MSEYIPDFFEDADMDDPRQMFAPLFSAWPKVEKMQPFPVARPLIPYHSEFAYKLGYRHHPELQELFKVKDSTGHRFVDRAELEELKAKGGTVEEAVARDGLLGMLASINPELANEIASLDESERTARVAAMGSEVDESMQQLVKLQSFLKEAVAYDDSRSTADTQ